MKKICYRLTVFLLATALLLGMVGCDSLLGGSNGTDTTGEPADAETTDFGAETTGAEADTLPTCTEHTYDGGVVVAEAKALRNGIKQVTCTACGHSYEEIIPMTKSIKVLAIGNSFSKHSVWNLWGILNDAGVETIQIAALHISSCTLEMHWNNISAENGAYYYYKNNAAGEMKTMSSKKTVQAAIAEEQWDFIIMQQESGRSGLGDTFEPYLSNMLSFVEEKAPTAKIVWHMTWSYKQGASHSGFANYNKDQLTMYQAIVNATKTLIVPNTRFAGIIPTGTAVQNLRTSYLGDTLNASDGYHLSAAHGKYTASLTWYAYLTGGSLSAVDWMPENYAAEIKPDLAAIHEAVNNALKTPFEVTQSTMTTKPKATDATLLEGLGLNIENYQLLDWQPKLGYYYYSTKDYGELHTSNKYTASALLTKAELPVGSVIIVDEGYEYRPEAWTTEAKLTTSRPGKVSKNVTLVDATWWGSYKYRAFNFSYTGASTTMTAADSTHLRIYVPVSK